MISGLAQTLCRFLAALVCFLCALTFISPADGAPPYQLESQLRAEGNTRDHDVPAETPDSREEREERELDDEDDDLDDWRYIPRTWLMGLVRAPVASAFSRAAHGRAPHPNHLSPEPRPPRRA